MNKKGIFFSFFFVPFRFPPLFYLLVLPVPRPHALSWLSPFSHPRSSLLRFLFSDLFLFFCCFCVHHTNELSS